MYYFVFKKDNDFLILKGNDLQEIMTKYTGLKDWIYLRSLSSLEQYFVESWG